MARPIVKYLDPISGEYEFATVVDVGDLRDLNTTIKSDIVGAINSIISDGVHNPINNEKIEELERIINSLKDGTFEIDDFGSIDEYLKQQFLDELDKINEKNREEIQSVLTQLDTSVDDAIKDYQEKVAAQNIILENAENTLADARDTLEAKAAELETANIGLSELETEFNELDNYISTNVRTIDFDNFNAMVEDYETVVTQTSDEVGVDMSGSTLSYLTGRVSDAEANISAQADEITSKMSYDEFQYMPVPKYDYGENLLFDTFDFGDAWSGKNGAQVTPDTFLFGKVVAFNSPTGLYETRTDDLTIGESYVFSTYVNVQPSEKSPSQGKYEPISKSYDPTDFKIQIGGKSFNPGVYENLSGINGWVRINQEFVADAVNPIISITPTGVNSQSEVAYMAMPKVEKGLTVTPWQPHVEDNYATISSTQSMIKQQANSITAFVTEVSELDDSYKQATSTFQMLADGFAANTEAVEAYEDAVTRYGTEYSNINGKFEQKVWKDDFDAIIEDINIDNRNRVLNSDFIRSEISSSDRRLIVEDWSLNSDWELKTIDNDEYLSRSRTGLTQNLITSASSNYFPVRGGERILFGFDLIHSGLDNDKVFAIELFDISNRRLLKQEFSLSSLTKVGNRYHGSFSISTPGVEKGSVVLQLPRNGSVSFTKISFQNADIGSTDWSPAPEDSWIIQSKLATYISQVEDEITIGGTGQKIDTLTGLLTEDKGTFTLNPDKIATEVLNSQTYDDMGFVNKTNFEQTADGWMQEITSEGRLAGYINASPDTYRISFDKIMLEGTTWADALGSSKITVTDNFALIGQNGRPVLDVNNDGSINMNVTSLKIGQYNALTTDDKSDIESEVADKVIKTTEPYIHIAYADTEDGAGLSFDPSGKQYIGFAKSHLPTPSGTASNYTWSKYVGADGYEGADGVGIESTAVRYALSTSGTSTPTDWLDKMPEPKQGYYLWTRTVITYTNGISSTLYTTSYSAKDGEKGDPGKDGVVGKDGVGIKSTTITYGVSANETTQPATYTSTVPTLVKGQYLWTKTVWVYTDDTTETGYTKTYIPKDGNDGKNGIVGKDGVGISKTTITYAKSSSGTTAPTTGYTTTVPSANPGEFIWTKTVWTYTDNTNETGYSVGKIGNTGASGKDGNPGKDGVGIQKTEIHYAKSTSGTTRPSTGWNLQVPSTSPGDYIWIRTTWTYTDGDVEEGYSVSRIGKDGNTGKDGNPGKDGVGIQKTVIDYATSSSGTVRPSSGWTTSVPSVTPGNYLWTRTIWTYTDNDTEEGYSVSRIGKDGAKGPQGPQGIQGPAGSNGQSQWVHVRYSVNSDGSGMDTKPSSTTKYVGIAVTNSATAPPYTGFTWSKYVGEDGSTGARGPQGLPGQKGTDGQTTYTWVRYADTPTSGMNQYPDGKKYIGLAFNQTTQDESEDYDDYQWSLMPQNIEIGGRNYWALAKKPWFSYMKHLGDGVFTNTSTRPSFSFMSMDKLGVDIGEDYTLSFEIKVSDNSIQFNNNQMYVNSLISNATHNKPTLIKDKWVKVFSTFNYSAENTTYAYIYIGNIPSSNSIEFRNFKLEKGNTATDWTPAPEDIQSQIDGLSLQDKTEILSGTEIYTDKADDDAVVHVEVDGKSYQHAGSGKNLFIPTRVIDGTMASQQIDNIDTLSPSGENEKFYEISGEPNKQYTFTFNYKHTQGQEPNYVKFFYSDGTDDGKSQGALDKTIWTTKSITSKPDKTVVGIGYHNAEVEWKVGTLEEIIPFSRTVINDNTKLASESYIRKNGVNGKRTYSVEYKWVNGVKTSETRNKKLTSTINPVNEEYVQGTMDVVWKVETYNEPIKFSRTTIDDKNVLPADSYIRKPGVNGSHTYSIEYKWVNGVKTSETRNKKLVSTKNPVNEEYVRGTMVVEWKQETSTETISFTRVTQDSSDIYPNESYVSREGVNGSITYSFERKWINGASTSETRNKVETSRKNAVNEIYIRGTKSSEWRQVTTYESIPYTTVRQNDNTIEVGTEAVGTVGKNGRIKVITEHKYVNNSPTGEKREVSRVTDIDMIPEVIKVGTKDTDGLVPFSLEPDVTPSTTRTTIDAFANKKTYNLVTDFGAVGDGVTDNFTAMKQAILSSVSEPVNIVVPKGNFYYRGPDNARLEVWQNKSQGIRFIGQDGAVLLPDHNRTQAVHESYVMQLVFDEDTSIGFAMEGLTIDGINAPQDIYHTMPNATNVTVPTLRGISIEGAQDIVIRNSTFKNIFGGYTVIATKYKQVDLSHIELDRCGGNAWTESFGGALYFGGHYGDATINIDNVHAEGYTDSRYPKLLGWIGIIFENGSVQLDNQSSWVKDQNTYFNVTNSSFLNYETGWHVETVAGNTYWNSDNVLYKVNNYAIVAALWGEIKEASNRIKTQLLPFGRTGIIKGMYYSEKEASKNENGLNDFKMYNSYVDVIDIPGFPSINQTMSYGDSVHSKYYNTTFNNVPNGLVTNGSTTVVNSEINLSPSNPKTDYQLQNGEFSKPNVHKVSLTNTNINRGVAKIAAKGSNPAKVKNTGYTPPPLTKPLGPATLERES